MYKEYKPPEALSKQFDMFWYTENVTSVERTVRILPDGCSDIIIPLSDNNSEPQFVGCMTKHRKTTLFPGDKMVGLRFNPGYSYELLRTDMTQIIDKIINLTFMAKCDFSAVQEDFQKSENINFGLIEKSLKKIIKPVSDYRHIYYALGKIRENNGLIRIEELADTLNISRRFLEKEFNKVLGITPKKYSRIVRFKRAASKQNTSLSELAVECGYYDQAHFIKDFKEFSGVTPTDYFL